MSDSMANTTESYFGLGTCGGLVDGSKGGSRDGNALMTAVIRDIMVSIC